MIRKRMTIAAIALAALAGTAGIAGAQQPTPPSTAPRAEAKQGAARRAGKQRAGKQRAGKRHAGKHHGRHKGAALQRATLRGVELTDAQKTQMKALRTKYKAESKTIVERMRPAMQEARAARQKGDTAAARAAFARTEQDRTALKSLRERQRTEMLATLTPEQRAKVDANVKAMKEKHAARRSRKA